MLSFPVSYFHVFPVYLMLFLKNFKVDCVSGKVKLYGFAAF